MRISAAAIGAAIVLASACGQTPEQRNAASPTPANLTAAEVAPVAPPKAAATVAQPVAAPPAAIDPNSAEAAGQLVQHYGALVERRRWIKAERLWGDVEAARAFATLIGGQFREVNVEIGKPAEPEGAAGSIYTTVPVTFFGETRRGEPSRRKADVILRRINDVPGSTEADRRWHIERIDWKNAG